MIARFRSRWWKVSKPLNTVMIIFLVALFAIIVLIIIGYIFNWDWTGLTGYNNTTTATEISSTPQKITRTVAYQAGKTLWDWLQLLIIPAVLAVGGYLFTYSISQNEQKVARLRDQTERDITLDNQREAALQAYIDKMSELLLNEKLRASELNDEVRTLARVRTLTVLSLLDGTRKKSAVQFLHESNLISKDEDIIDLSGADLSNANLTRADLSNANLTRADLSNANLTDANLTDANLTRAVLSNANLTRAVLTDADLSNANLTNANLTKAMLVEANFFGADLTRADLTEVDLFGADFFGAIYQDARLSEADFIQAELSEVKHVQADLDRIRANAEQLNIDIAIRDANRTHVPYHPIDLFED